MKQFEGQFSLQDELDRAGAHKDYLEKQNKEKGLSSEEKMQLEKQRLEDVKTKELERLKELDEKDNAGEEYFGRFEQFKKRNIK